MYTLKEGYRKGESRTGGMKNRRYAGQCTGGIKERWDAGKEGCRKGGMQKGGMQEKRNAGKEGCRKGRLPERRGAGKDKCKEGGAQERTSFCVVIVLCNSHKQLPFSYNI